MKTTKKRLALQILTVLAIGLYQIVTFALPTQGTLDNTKAATITTADNVMTISGKGKNNILNWANFQVANGEKVQFIGNNNYLNLVHGVDISRIYGTISGGNTVYLVNPNGILFGQGTKIDNVGNFIASTRNISSIDKEAFLNDPTNTAKVLGADNTIMDNKDYYPDTSTYVPKISVAEMQLTNVPASATKIILDGPGGVILKNTDLLNQTTQVITRQNGGEIGIGSDTGSITLNDTQKAKISLVNGSTTSVYRDDAGVLQGYQYIDNINDLGFYNGRYMINTDIDATNLVYPLESKGILEGMGYTISNLKMSIYAKNSIYVGLFETYSGEIRNLDLANVEICANSKYTFSSTAASLAAVFENGLVSNITTTGEVSSTGLGGGLLGIVEGTVEIRNSNNYTSVKDVSDDNRLEPFSLGGIIGICGGNISLYNVKNFGEIKASKDQWGGCLGGIVGQINQSGNSKTVVQGAYNAGSIIGINMNTLWLKSIAVGGLIGNNSSNYLQINDCYSDGIVRKGASADKGYIGGIVANNTGSIKVTESTLSGKVLKSFYLKDNVIAVNGTDFGVGVTQEEMTKIFNQDMIGVHDFSRTQGDVISGVPDNGGAITPPVDPGVPVPPADPDVPVTPPIDPNNPSDPTIPPSDSNTPVKPSVPDYDRGILAGYEGVINGILNDDAISRKNSFSGQSTNTQKDNGKPNIKYETPQENYDRQKENLIKKIMSEFKDAQSKYQEQKEANKNAGFEELKSYIQTGNGMVFDDKVYEAFLNPIREKMEKANLDDYDEKVGSKFVQQIVDMISNGIVHTEDQKVKVNGVTYTIHYDLDYSLHKMTTVIATVSWKEGRENKSTTMTLTNVNTPNGVKALENYASGLSKLNKNVWENAASEFLSCGLSEKTSGAKERIVKDVCTKLLTAFGDDRAAEAFAKDMGGATNQYIIAEGKGIFTNHAKNGLKKFVKNVFSDGDEIIKAVDQLQVLETLKDNCSTYSSSDTSANEKLNAYWNASNMLVDMILKI